MNHVYSAAYGYTPAQLIPFLASAQKHLREFQAHLFVYTEDLPSLAVLTQRFSFLHFHDTPRPRASEKLHSWIRDMALAAAKTYQRQDRRALSTSTLRRLHTGLNACITRFFLIEQELAKLPDDPASIILHCDSRDIIFQENIFTRLTHPLLTGAEPGTVGRRDSWVGRVYGSAGQVFLHQKQVYCAGCTLGRLPAFRAYIRAMCDEQWAHLHCSLFHRGPDQAIHINLIHRGKIDAHCCHNFEGPIATIALEASNNLSIDQATQSILVHGIKPAILHQYDRHASLRKFVEKQYPSDL